MSTLPIVSTGWSTIDVHQGDPRLHGRMPRRRRCFARAATRRARRSKPVVIVKVGRTDLGAAAAASHTAALAGADAIYDAVFKQYGAFRAATIEEAFDVAYAVSVAGVARGHSIGMLTVSGGAGVMMADAAASLDLDATPLPEAAQKQDTRAHSVCVRRQSRRRHRPGRQRCGGDAACLLAHAGRRRLRQPGVVPVGGGTVAAARTELVQQAGDMRAKYPDRVIRPGEPVHPGAAPEARRGQGSELRRSRRAPCVPSRRSPAMRRVGCAAGEREAGFAEGRSAARYVERGEAHWRASKAAGIPMMPHESLATKPATPLAAADAIRLSGRRQDRVARHPAQDRGRRRHAQPAEPGAVGEGVRRR